MQRREKFVSLIYLTMTSSNIIDRATCSAACNETAIRWLYEYGVVRILVERRIGARSGRASKLVA